MLENHTNRTAREVLVLQQIAAIGERLRAQAADVFPSTGSAGTKLGVLLALAEAGRHGLSQAQVAASIRRSPGVVTRLVDEMESQGVVVRNPHPFDRRQNVLRLTPDGRTYLETHRARQARLGHEALDGEGDPELKVILAALGRIISRLELH